MMSHWTRFLTLRYLFTHNGKKGHLGNTLAILGLSIGIMTLLTVLTVMNGFQQSFITSINEIYSYHIRITADDGIDPEKLSESSIRSAVPFKDQQGIFTTDQALNSGGQIRFLDFKAAQEDSVFLKELNLLEGNYPEKESQIILGRDLARYISVDIGDTLSFSYLDTDTASFKSSEMTVIGIFKSGYYEYDRNIAFTSLDGFMNPPYTIGIKLENQFRDNRVLNELKALYPGLKMESWRQYNSAFFNALKIEKIFMFLIVGLIFIVVSVNIYHSMKRNVKERLLELALIKAVGGTAADVMKIYTNQGILISLVSSLAGTVLGMLLSYNVNRIIQFFIDLQFRIYEILILIPGINISPPGQFYFTEIPIQFFLNDIVIINVTAFLTVMTAAYYSVKQTSKVLPGEIFRNE